MKKLFSLFAAVLFAGSMMAAEKAVENVFNSTTMGKGISGYDQTWTNTSGTTLTLVNFNNNNKGWSLVKCGSKKNPSVGTITTASALAEKITRVEVTVDAFTSGKVNDFYLLVSSASAFTTADTVRLAIAQGVNKFNIASEKQAENLYYRLVVDCAKGTSNGLVTISKVDFYYDFVTTNPTISVASNTVDLGTVYVAKDQTATIKHTLTIEGLNLTNGIDFETSANLTFNPNTLPAAGGDVEVTISDVPAGDFSVSFMLTSEIGGGAQATNEVTLTGTVAEIDMFDSFEALVEADVANQTSVQVTFEGIEIDSIYVNNYNSNRQGIYFTVDGTAYEIYFKQDNVPAAWVAGGKVSGSIIGTWTYYTNGAIWELVPAAGFKWADLTYVAPSATAISNTAVEAKAVKSLENGMLVIENAGKKYNVMGQIIK